MLQRIERSALSRSDPAGAIERSMPPAGSTLALPRGEIAGDFRATGRVDKRRRETYQLSIANNTAAPIASFAYALEGRQKTRITWDAIIVPAHSAVAVDIVVQLPKRGRPRMIAELYAHDSQLVLDARSDDARSTGRPGRALAALGIFAVLLAGSFAYAGVRPRVAALAAPSAVHGGTPFAVAYAARGASAEYAVDTPAGVRISAGALDPRDGSFSVTVPRADVALGYDVRVAAHGPLGNDVRTVHVTALAPEPVAVVRRPRLRPVNVTQVVLDNDSVTSGQPIVVSYRSTVTTGTVRLIDQYGTVRGETPLSPHGRSTLVAPPVDADQDLRIVVSAQSGSAHAASAVPVTIRRGDPSPVPGLAEAGVPGQAGSGAPGQAGANAAIVPALGAAAVPGQEGTVPAPEAAPEDAAAAGILHPKKTLAGKTSAVNDPAEPIVVTPGPPISVEAHQLAGQPVRVHVLHHDAGLRLSLMGPGGNELVSESVAPGTSSVLMQAPADLSPSGGGYSIVATFSRGVGQETVIRPIVFAR